MKHVKLFEAFVNEELVNKYAKAGRLGYNDQFLDRKKSLSKTLSMDLGLDPDNEFGGGDWLGFDGKALYVNGGKKEGTILADALSGKYTYDELKAAAAKFLGIKEAFINEAKELELDKDLAEITLRKMIEKDGDRPFSEEVYLSLFDREDIQREYGNKLPRGFAGPNKSMHISTVLKTLAGDSVYMDDADLVLGDKTVHGYKYGKSTLNDVVKLLKIKI